jgi:DegV family protein with EDD domain
MKKISLIIGETSSLPKEIVERYGMVVVPYIVDWPDGEKIPGENIFQKMRNAEKEGIKGFPKTSQPPPGVFKKIFEEELKRAEKLLVLTLSSKLSGGYNSAIQAREMVSKKERIFVLDTLNVTIGEGLIDLYVAKMIEKGKDEREILKEFPKIVKNIHLFGMVENPKWLEKGGRISHSFAVLLEKMQKIGMRPLIGVKNGEVKPVALKMRAKDVPEALFRELEKEIEKIEEKNEIKVAIGHADNLEGAKKLKELIEENLKGIEILFLGLIDPIIGVHVGPGTLAIAWSQFKL